MFRSVNTFENLNTL